MNSFWVFGYGSLMWRPGFDCDERRVAVLDGWHRAFCVWSRHWRGTADKPGLVLGLDEGGSCRGVAFRVEASREAAVIDYLTEREMIGYAYQPRRLPVTLDGGGTVSAYTFVADRAHHNYAGRRPADEAAQVIMDAQGVGGLNRDYLINTVRHLEQDGFVDPDLHDLLVAVERLTGIIDQGAGI
ncbi:MAG: gamma-glutamylcyclotransferase [Actinomycetota bacterium]